MIDPKLNEIPVEGRVAADETLDEAQKSERRRGSRTGLSISDTIAGDTTLSSGSRGVDTSGVSAGAGAGAGLSNVTPGRGDESPAPNLAPNATGTGTTPRGGVNPAGLAESTRSATFSEAISNRPPSSREPVSTGGAASAVPNTLDVAERAYQIWCSKGCPQGTAEEDWHQAERELTSERSGNWSRAAAI